MSDPPPSPHWDQPPDHEGGGGGGDGRPHRTTRSRPSGYYSSIVPATAAQLPLLIGAVAAASYVLLRLFRGRFRGGGGSSSSSSYSASLTEEERRERRLRALKRFDRGQEGDDGDGGTAPAPPVAVGRRVGGATGGGGGSAPLRRRGPKAPPSSPGEKPLATSPLPPPATAWYCAPSDGGKRTSSTTASSSSGAAAAATAAAALPSSATQQRSADGGSRDGGADVAAAAAAAAAMVARHAPLGRDVSATGADSIASSTTMAESAPTTNGTKGGSKVIKVKVSGVDVQKGRLPIVKIKSSKRSAVEADEQRREEAATEEEEAAAEPTTSSDSDAGSSSSMVMASASAPMSPPKQAEEEEAAAVATTEENKIGNSTTDGRKRRSVVPRPPPAQLLCEALSTVTALGVSVEPGRGAWGGEGWITRKRPRPGGGAGGRHAVLAATSSGGGRDAVMLPLVRFRPRGGEGDGNDDGNDDRAAGAAAAEPPLGDEPKSRHRGSEWSNLERALRSILASPTSDPFRTHLCLGTVPGGGNVATESNCALRTAAAWHSRTFGPSARDSIDRLLVASSSNGLGDGVDSVDRAGLGACLSVLAEHIAGQVARSMSRELAPPSPATAAAAYDDSSDDDEGLDDTLFSDGYGAAAAPQTTATTGLRHENLVIGGSGGIGSSMDQLLDLCGEPDASRTVTRCFLADVMSGAADGAGPKLARTLLKQALGRLPPPDGVAPRGVVATPEAVRRYLSAVSYLLSNSPDVAAALSAELKREAADVPSNATTGRELERKSLLRPLLSAGAYTLLDAGFDGTALRSTDQRLPLFYVALKSTPAFPLGTFDKRGMDPAIGQVVDEARSAMRSARTAAGVVLERCMKKGGRGEMFDWLGRLIRANEAIVNVLQEQLLDTDNDIHAQSCSRSFLLGTALAVLDLCCQNLVDKGANSLADSFDVRYLIDGGGGALALPSEERRLVCRSSIVNAPPILRKFTGATQFFFLTAALLRVSLFPALRAREEFQRRREQVFQWLEEAAVSEMRAHSSYSEQHSTRVPEKYCRTAGALLGWTAIFDDRDLIVKVVEFSLLQLRWLLAIADNEETAESSFALIPEWMAKLPAQWIGHVAVRSPACITPHQGELAVQCATKLLGSSLCLSPPVKTELIRIASAFVAAGVSRAKRRHAARHRRTRFRHSSVEDGETNVANIDLRDLDIYHSFDSTDLGVTVFTNHFVSSRLPPTLIDMFVTLDAVEGVDVEREHHFDKFQVKSEVADLLLRLWLHPSGECRNSIVRLSDETLSNFVRSVRAAIGLLLDDAIQKLNDIRGILKQWRGNARDKLNMKFHSKHLASGLAQSRRLLLVLCYLTEESKIASILGGGAGGTSSVSADLATMVVSFLDKFTSEDGGMHPELDLRQLPVPTSELSARLKAGVMTAPEKEAAVNDLLHSRTFLFVEYGLDVSVLAHLLLGLAARWHHAAKDSRGGGESSLFLGAFVSNEDSTIEHMRNIFLRLISTCQEARGERVSENALLIFERDGHVDPSIWKERYKMEDGILETCRARKHSAQQDQMTHSRLDRVANIKEISAFLDDLEQAKASVTPDVVMPMGKDDIEKLERKVLKSGQPLEEEQYTDCLSEWVVSSDSFLSTASPNDYDHFYNSNAKSGSNPGSGKSLIKEARKCYRNLPQPHPNASIFVCFAEERMDICRAVIIGAVDTPYSLGVFEFDVFFPAQYPLCSPMMTFMTTGGGQIRFNPNLYNDGKVCISLLGTANAWDESQRWNPDHSSLAQVLISIQTQILGVPEPYFNEGGGHEGMRGTRAGIEGSARYNASLRLATLRFAIIGALKTPPRGFEEVTRRHFAMCRKRLLVQAKRWMMEARGTTIYKRFVRAYDELLGLLSADGLIFQDGTRFSANDKELGHQVVKKADSEVFGALHPLAGDMQAMQNLDYGLYQHFSESLQDVFDEEDFENSDEVFAGLYD